MPRSPLCLKLAFCALIVFLVSQSHAIERQAFLDLHGRLVKLRAEDAAKAVAEGQQILATDTLSPDQTLAIYQLVATIQTNDLKDIPAALASLDEGARKLPGTLNGSKLILEKARLLLAEDRGDEAEVLMQKQWPEIKAAGYDMTALPLFVQVLQRTGQDDLAIQTAEQTLSSRIENLGAAGELIRMQINQLLAMGRSVEAERWAKLYFVLCPFDERAMGYAVRNLVLVWASKPTTPDTITQRIKTLQTPDATSSLHGCGIPLLDTDNVKKRLAASTRPVERISFLLLLNENAKAMVAARQLMLEQPLSNEGVLQVCRVFKANDLNIARANAFLEFQKTGRGKNPVNTFIEQIKKGLPTIGNTEGEAQ